MPTRGLDEWFRWADDMVSGMDDAVYKAVRDAALVQKKAVRANISGPPRWNRGQNDPRSGGPGVLTGRLQRSVSYVKIQKLGHGHYQTKLVAKRIYAAKVERQYPYFLPGLRGTDSEVQRTFTRHYAAVWR